MTLAVARSALAKVFVRADKGIKIGEDREEKGGRTQDNGPGQAQAEK